MNIDMNEIVKNIGTGCKYKHENGVSTYYSENSNEAIRISNGCIMFTTSGFDSSNTETAISPLGIFAKNLIGQVILGEKLYIKSDDNLFYIGKVNGIYEIDDDGKNFGLKIENNDENNLASIFLGLVTDENGNKIPKFSLSGQSGNICLDDRGIVCPIQFCDRDLVDEDCSMKTYYRVPENVSELRRVKLFVKFDTFKCYSKGSRAGGFYQSSWSSSSSAGGGCTASSEAGGGINSIETHTSNSTYGFGTDENGYIPFTNGFLLGLSLMHKHDINFVFNIDPHSHEVIIPEHQHEFLVDVNIPEHQHEEILGCYDSDFLPQDVSIKINGVTAFENLNRDCDVDITQYLRKNYINEIELASSCKGKFIINIYGEQFMQY